MVFVASFRVLAFEDAVGMATSYNLIDNNIYRDLYQPAVIIAGCFVFLSLVLSFHLIFQHLRSYTNPAEQKWIVAVLLMVPIYASESILSLWNPSLSLACDILRNCYEAFALYSFGSYLIACLGGERRVIELLEDESRKLLSKPLLEEEGEKSNLHTRACGNFFLQPSVLGKDLLTIEKFGLVQYMILKIVCAFLAFLLELFGVYGDGEFKWYYGYPYMAVVLNFSQMWALYCLVQFYNVTHERLQPIKPLAKFISFKAIVFATWWQGVGIALLCALGVLPSEGKLQTGLQDFLICIEMAIAAVAHVFVFSAKPYHFLPAPDYGKITTQTTKESLRLEEGDKLEKLAVLGRTDTEAEAAGTSVKESIQDIVVEGGQHVVKDVVLTINQAIEPVGKGVSKIQESFHQRTSVAPNAKKDEPDVQVEEHVEQILYREGSHHFSSEETLIN
ncbi:protein LAZ1 homolog 2 [Diospyros lotus]|uniref:protein LAZ1 homolog 2 n=1 Tax=Diospyros lotus TaxID=55363 RepID=UPI002252A437|nr:protein LAZ1 homolog 2 [Diospyros lotus]XP_052200540.1 protein LAZ1 homolog 2 [Diospyros lotus]